MKRVCLLLAGMAVSMLAGCATPVPRCTAPEDNPNHHYLRGMEALEATRVDTAMEKFDRALYCAERFSAAYSGRAIAFAMKARLQSDNGYRGVEIDRAHRDLEQGDDTRDSANDHFENRVASMRVFTLLKQGEWLGPVEEAYRDALGQKVDERLLVYYQGREAATYFMGLAYLESYEFRKAENAFRETLAVRRDGKWNEPADRAWKKTSKIVRAMGGMTVGDVGRKIAVKEDVSRGDLAALLVDELKLDRLFAGRLAARSELEKMKAEFTPADILKHPFREEILTVLKWKVRGLEPKFDPTTKAYLFKAEESVSRGEMAFILEDVLMKLTGDEKLATAFFGQDRSPFPDVKATSPFYNAVLNMTTRGIMEGELTGDFRINDPVDGAEAILAVRMLQQRMNIH